MSLYQCNCGTYYTEPKEATNIIASCIENKKAMKVVLICQNCGEKSVHGGEPDFDYFDDSSIIMRFGGDYIPEDDKDIPHFNSIILEECDEDKSEFATYDNGIIHLKRKK